MKRIALGVLIAPPVWYVAWVLTWMGISAGLEIAYQRGQR